MPISIALDVASLLRAAQKKSGLKDFGDLGFVEALDRLLLSIHSEAKLHTFGKFITKQRLINVLVNRLRIEDILKKHPEIAEIKLDQVIIITGLQRTGTTRMHRLLSAHPSVRSLTSWEALNPAPIPGDVNNKRRIAFAKTAERALKYMSPEFFAIHPVEHGAPEEDILLNDMTFISTVPEATMHVPSYASWVQNQSHQSAYLYLRKVLQVLSWQNPGKRWVLKTPQYMEFLDEASSVFPDAKFIHCYRDPLKVLPSFFSMVYQSRRIFSDEADAQIGAKHWLEKNKHMLSKAMHYWTGSNVASTLHISYYDMMQNPTEEMKKIYAFTGLDCTHEVLQRLEKTNEDNQQNKYGKHQYQLSDFGLSKEEIESVFKDYRQQFNIPYE